MKNKRTFETNRGGKSLWNTCAWALTLLTSLWERLDYESRQGGICHNKKQLLISLHCNKSALHHIYGPGRIRGNMAPWAGSCADGRRGHESMINPWQLLWLPPKEAIDSHLTPGCTRTSIVLSIVLVWLRDLGQDLKHFCQEVWPTSNFSAHQSSLSEGLASADFSKSCRATMPP